MTNEEIAVKLEDHEHEIGSLKHRMEAVEAESKALNRLATAVEVMATRQENMSKSLDKLTGKVEVMEAKPAKRWDGIVDKLIAALVGAFLAWALTGAAGL